MPSLPPNACLQVVLSACPIASHFDLKVDYSDIYLSGLGVKDDFTKAVFIKNIKQTIKPWLIDATTIPTDPDTSVQDAADAVQQGAYAK